MRRIRILRLHEDFTCTYVRSPSASYLATGLGSRGSGFGICGFAINGLWLTTFGFR